MAGFDTISAKLQEALDHEGGSLSLTDVWNAIEAGTMQLWTRGDSALVTTLAPYPSGAKDLVLFLAGGSLEELEPLIAEVTEWGRQQGATRAVAAGRVGWGRSFLTKSQGWKTAGVVLTRSLN
jgi:hypothetical protein